MDTENEMRLAYLIGLALGDGNLSNPNGRATRLRITCDARYVRLAEDIKNVMRDVFPKNKVSLVPKGMKCFDISVYSNRLNAVMPWRVGKGPKGVQHARVPEWIRDNKIFSRECLRGLIQTDGCIYHDRGYLMINFVNNTYELARDAHDMLCALGYRPNFITLPLDERRSKYTVRITRKSESQRLLDELALYKS